MKTLLVIQSSLFGENGQSSRLTQQFVQRWQAAHPDGRVIERDVTTDAVPHLTAEGFAGFQVQNGQYTPAQRATLARSDSYIRELREADEIAIGLPMYNLGIPSQLKAWFDHVARAGVTFKYTENGPVGLIGDKPVTVLAARGGMYQGTPKDSQSQHVRDFLNLLGITRIEFIYAEGLGMGEAQVDKAMTAARVEIDRLAA